MLKGLKAALHKRIMIIWFTVLIVLALLPDSFMRETPLQFSITIVLFISYIFLFWFPKKNWKSYWAELIAVAIGIFSLLKGLLVGGEAYGMMMPLAIFIGYNIGTKRSHLYATFFAIVATLLLIFDTDLRIQHIVSFILSYSGCYLGSRGYRIQNEAYEASQLHYQELQKAHGDLQEAHRQLQEAAIDTMQIAVLEERTRIARDIHDALGHSLTSLIVQLHALKYMLHEGPPQAQEAVHNMLGVAKQSLEDIRSSVHTLASDNTWLGLNPLRALVSQVEKHTGLQVEIITEESEVPLPQQITISLYRILQEAITNTLRHSDAKHLQVIVEMREQDIRLCVKDDGSITRDNKIRPGFGLTGIQERIEMLNGTLSYFIREPHGFQLEVTIPTKIGENPPGEEQNANGRSKQTF